MPPSRFQPFQCLVCQSRFTRHENLKRHAALHRRSDNRSEASCELCHATFSRPDLRRRHMKRKHLHAESPAGRRGSLRSEATPSLSPESASEVPDDLASLEQASALMDGLDMQTPSFTLDSLTLLGDDYQWAPTSLQIAHGCELFFTHIGPFVPFLHRATFDALHAAGPLLMGMLCLAYQHGHDPEFADDVDGHGETLSSRCFERAQWLVVCAEETEPASHDDKISLVQAYLLLQIYAIMYRGGDASPYGFKTHSKMIALARSGGLMLPLPPPWQPPEDLDALWRAFVHAESHKRTLLAVHQVDALWYQVLSLPRSLSHLEIKHDLPCPEDAWTAATSAAWAHCQLMMPRPGPSVAYPEAVRCFLAGDLAALPAFDAYGAINIAQFLASSAREISGWSTMTGMVSMERLAPLRTSLVALGPFVAQAPHARAAWEAAMVEVHMWSPSHTGGIVAASVDTMLHQLTALPPPCDVVGELVQPHVDWFLRLLDATGGPPEAEAPWVTLYAYKAWMIAWQLVRTGAQGAMAAVGVAEGDCEAALAWARHVFQPREKWRVGKIILACLDELEKDL